METPKSNSRRLNPRKYHPTPKMSERKKALFTPKSSEKSPSISSYRECSDDDSDLGIMSPLQHSSSSSKYDSDDSGPTSFKDVLNSSNSSRKKNYESRFSNSGKYEFVPASLKPTLSDLTEESDVQTPKQLKLNNAWIDISHIEADISAPILLMTPCGTSTKDKIPKSSFRKTIVDSDGDRTPIVEDQPAAKRAAEEEKDPKARTSLFSEGSIPTKNFYSGNETKKDDSPNCSILAAIRQNSKIGSRLINNHKQKRHSYPLTIKKRRSSINRGVFHKIHKQRTRKPKVITRKSAAKMTKDQLIEAAMNIIDNSPLNSYLNSSLEVTENDKRRRVSELLKNMTNSIELARPLNIEVPQQNPFNDDSDVENNENAENLNQNILDTTISNETLSNRKFFKSKTEKRAKYEIMKGHSAILDQSGKLSLAKSVEKPKKRKLRSLFDDDFEFAEEQQEVNDILKSLEDPKLGTPLKEGPVNVHQNSFMSPTTTQISSLASKFAALNPVSDQNSTEESQKLFPLFEKSQQKVVNLEPEPKRVKVTNEWRPIGDDQLQIDAGQKEFGAIECKTCGFIYTQHVPEDEMLHQQFHNSCQILNFKGWEKENRCLDVYEWGVAGRVIAISNSDSKTKMNRAQEILRLADMELGFAQIPLHQNAIIFLACNNKEIMGLCVAQPQSEANKLISEFGIDFCSSETYPVKCGISRIWVNSRHRRKGVASKLFEAVKGNFMYGCRLNNDEIAFSAPTEMGKAFAEKIMGKKDFYVYQ
ncbi:N-acetyltransferase ESCO2 [Culicoides brevitarsis]|uniref:N-acetyltransferase ESCO2 n=1 Tax=Culicoides brevitarsis TaxID=469753 RepID=UPI00307C186E